MKRQQRGFTLIEIMIVVAILGILAAIAFVGYQQFTTRARMTEVFNYMANCKTAFTETAASGGLPNNPSPDSIWAIEGSSNCAGNQDLNLKHFAKGPYLVMRLNDNRVYIGGEMRNFGNSDLDGKVIYLAGEVAADKKGVDKWKCPHSDINPAARKYLPATCQNKDY